MNRRGSVRVTIRRRSPKREVTTSATLTPIFGYGASSPHCDTMRILFDR